MILRDYQQRAIDWIGKALEAGFNPLLIAPTGSGKTVMLAEIARGRNAIALAHRRELITQMRAVGIEAYTWQSYNGQPCELMIVDEAHHVAPGTRYAEIIAGKRVLGATATPWRLDGKALQTFDASYVAATPRELLESGVLVPYTGFAYRSVETEGIKRVAGDYSQGALGEAASRPQLLGDIVTRWKQTASELSTLAFAVNIAHAKALAAEFQTQGVDAAYLTGADRSERREQLFARLASRQLSVLVNVAIATEGVDIPSLECLILARPTLSETLALQMVGRVLRSHPGKTHARIHDHAQVILSHGSPYADRDWSPRPDRKRTAASGGGSQQICHACLALISASARSCSVCGVVLREAREVAAGEGVEVPLESLTPALDTNGYFEGPYPGRAAFPVSTVLDRSLAPIAVGTQIRVTYRGERRSAKGFRYHDYRVENLEQALSARELGLLREG